MLNCAIYQTSMAQVLAQINMHRSLIMAQIWHTKVLHIHVQDRVASSPVDLATHYATNVIKVKV